MVVDRRGHAGCACRLSAGLADRADAVSAIRPPGATSRMTRDTRDRLQEDGRSVVHGHEADRGCGFTWLAIRFVAIMGPYPLGYSSSGDEPVVSCWLGDVANLLADRLLLPRCT